MDHNEEVKPIHPRPEGRGLLGFLDKFRLTPNQSQKVWLDSTLGLCQNLYNCALEHRITAYKIAKKTINYYDQSKVYGVVG